jgi:hypothetical protein
MRGKEQSPIRLPDRRPHENSFAQGQVITLFYKKNLFPKRIGALLL